MLIEANDTIGQRVKMYRKHLGFSQDELAEGICSRQTISILENDQHIPSAETLHKIALRLGVPLREIIADHSKELDLKIQIEIAKVYVEVGDYEVGLSLIHELENENNLLEYQKRQLVLPKAECLLRTGEAESAVQILLHVHGRLEEEQDADLYFKAALNDKLGTAYFFLSNIANAYAYYMRAYQYSLKFPTFDILAARITYNLGMSCRLLNRHTDSITYLSMAESFFKKVADTKKVAHVLFELGIAYRANHELKHADQFFQESLALYRSLNMINMVNHIRQNHAYSILSKIDPDEAISVLLECVEGFKTSDDRVRLAYTYSFIAEILLKKQNSTDSGKYIQQALNLFSFEEAQREFRLAYVYHVYAMYLLEINDLDSCIEYSIKCSKLFDNMGYIREAANALQLSANAFREKEMWQQAYEVMEQVNDLLCRSQDQIESQMEVF